ncbi:MAG: F0F1 ATP synthase subunit delta [Candidatus Omnitrophica bacterium]|nr:F0F1 ATP synthase subunit delta [Candidatus Omnitrophota bacterium]
MLIIQLVIIQIVTFIFIVFFIRWLLGGQIAKAVQRLRKLNQENRAKEKELKKEEEMAKKEIEREIKEGKLEAEKIKQDATEEAERKQMKLLKDAKEKANRIVEEGKKDLQKQKNDFILNLQNKAVNLATEMMAYVLTEKTEKNIHNQFTDEIIDALDEFSKDKIKSEGDKAEVVSVFELTQAQKGKIKGILSKKLDKDIKIVQSIDKKLVGGLIIKLGGFTVVDGSIKRRFQKLIPLMKEKIEK